MTRTRGQRLFNSLRQLGQTHLHLETDLALVLDLFGTELTDSDHLGKRGIVLGANEASRFFSFRFSCSAPRESALVHDDAGNAVDSPFNI